MNKTTTTETTIIKEKISKEPALDKY